MKEFIIKTPDQLPEERDNGISDWFFGIAVNIHGVESKTLTIYDFKNKKWLMLNSGMKVLKEYYDETDKH